jgi:hypothetical protein
MSPADVEQMLEQLQGLAVQLRQRAPLQLGKVCFCRAIESFGQYQPLESDYSFQAGCDGRPGERVQVYAEVRNFASRLRNGQHETMLSSSLDVYDRTISHDRTSGSPAASRGKCRPVVTMNLGTCTDRSQTPRQDYFLNFRFHVPTRLPPGRYTLQVTVRDVTPVDSAPTATGRIVTRSLDFNVCPPGTRPLGP